MDHIEGLSPAISIEQKSTSHNPRSTVGTITEIYDYLRLLFARVGEPHCPEHGIKLEAQTVSQMVDQVMALPEGARVMVLAPIIRERKGEHVHVFKELRTSGFIRARVDGLVCEIDYPPELENKKHSIDVVVDRLKIKPGLEQRLAESFETAIQLAEGLAMVAHIDDGDQEEMLFPRCSPAPSAVTASLSLSPGCFHSTTLLAPAPPVTDSALSSSLTNNALSQMTAWRWQKVRFGDGTGGTSGIFKCSPQWLTTTVLRSTHRLTSCRRKSENHPLRQRQRSHRVQLR